MTAPSAQFEQTSYTVDIGYLQRSIAHEAFLAMGLQPGNSLRWLLGPLFYLPTRRFATLAARFDACTAQGGLVEAARWLLPRLARHVDVQGIENIPHSGPLVIACNHPGAYDGMVILSLLPRTDVNLMISDVPFTRGLPETSKYLIYSTGDNVQARMSAVRASLRHLRDNGVLMLFATGVVDPDPAFMPGAEAALENWSDSLEFFLQKEPRTLLIPTIISGVLAPRFLNHHLARRQPTLRRRQKVAEYLEVIQMMALGKDLNLTPAVSFGTPMSLSDLRKAGGSEMIMPTIVQSARQLLTQHARRFNL